MTTVSPSTTTAARPDFPETPAELVAPERRVDGRAKVTGAARYAADHRLAGVLQAHFLGSPHAHARLARVDAAAARAVPGVHAVLTGADVGEIRTGRRLLDWPILAVDRVRFIGDRVAAVAAESLEAADEALRRIAVEYEELPALLDVRGALAADAVEIHPARAGYRYLGGTRPPIPHPNVQGHRVVEHDAARIEEVFAGAHRTFEDVFTTPAQHPGYLEPHATVVLIEPDGIVRVLTANKAPFSLRSQMAEALDLAPGMIDVDSDQIGGDFGGKGLSIDEYGCYLLARATGRPVRAVMSSTDELRTMNPRHAAWIRLRTAVDADGRFLAHDAQLLFDGGAYAAAKPLPHLVLAGGFATLSAYRVPHVRMAVTTVYTNHAPAGHVRAPGEVQALFAGESHVDRIARELGRDPLEFRLENAVRDGDVGIAGDRFREARAIEILETLRRESAWRETPRRDGVGRGVALGVRHVGGGKTSIRVRLLPDGSLEVISGTPDQGGGASTVLQRVLAVALGVEPARITIRRASTLGGPVDPGVGGSRVTHLLSRAAQAAAERLAVELRERLAARLGEPVAHSEGAWLAASGRRLDLREAAAVLAPDVPEVVGAYDAGTHGHDEPGDYDFCGYVIDVGVDRETGQVTIRDALLVADVGTVINPTAHRGQLLGGFAFGVGAALIEELVREDGQVVSATLGDAKLPTALDVPKLRIVHLPTGIGPGAFGAKMVGELSNAAVAPAVANAVADAVGVRVTSLPITAEKVSRAIAEGG